ncbi:MAG TPA: dihydrolipoamide acetyltransferase family protein, partial [Rhodothermales bacterium]|nr:dihydrolipoamide acetyltransferase family protein [Rhodothermales bacterium]
VEEGETVEVGTAIAIIVAEAGASDAPTPSTPEPAAQPSGNGEQESVQQTTPQPAPQSSGDGAVMEPQTQEAGSISRHTDDGRFISPLVRSIAETEGLSMDELAQISGSGREGRITKKDVMNYLANRSAPQPAAPTQPKQPAPSRPAQPAARPLSQPVVQETEEGERVEIIEMDRMRQIIADHMVRSKATSAHVTSFGEADVTNLVKLREANKQAFLEREGIKLTYTPFFVHAAVEALADHPILNASVEGKRIVVKKNYHIGIAVAIEKAGLIVPVIRNAGRQNIVGLAHSASDLAQRARSKQLQPDDLQGGTFTVTNVGSLGSIMGTPIIPQPQVAIIATGAIKKRPVVLEDPNLGDVIAIRHMMYLSLSYDHRIIDGAMGVSFLRKFVEVIESIDPEMEI